MSAFVNCNIINVNISFSITSEVKKKSAKSETAFSNHNILRPTLRQQDGEIPVCSNILPWFVPYLHFRGEGCAISEFGTPRTHTHTYTRLHIHTLTQTHTHLCNNVKGLVKLYLHSTKRVTLAGNGIWMANWSRAILIRSERASERVPWLSFSAEDDVDD